MRRTLRALALAGALAIGALDHGASPARAQTWGVPGYSYSPYSYSGYSSAPYGYGYGYGQAYGYGQGWSGWSSASDRWAARGVYAPYSSNGGGYNYSSNYGSGGGTFLPMRPPYNGGYREHYGYPAARRETKLYKPWLGRD